MEDWRIRTRMLLGEEAVGRLEGGTVAIFGLGGVGGWALEALTRAGIGHLQLVDLDTLSASNKNRQSLALESTLGQPKTAVARQRASDICPQTVVETRNEVFSTSTMGSFFPPVEQSTESDGRSKGSFFPPVEQSTDGEVRDHIQRDHAQKAEALPEPPLKPFAVRPDVVIDAHNTLRSHLLLALMRRRPQARLAKDTAARLAFMKWGRTNSCLSRTMRERFFDLFQTLAKNESTATAPPLMGLRESDAVDDRLGVAPGAQWDSKRWPEENFAQLVCELRATTGAQIKVFLGPREKTWFPSSELAKVVAADDSISLVQVPDLVSVAKQLASCKYVITNDSGILHLSETVGTPVLAFYGPTVAEFGYFPLLPSSRVLEHDLACRPCSRNGKRACHRGDLACLTSISHE